MARAIPEQFYLMAADQPLSPTYGGLRRAARDGYCGMYVMRTLVGLFPEAFYVKGFWRSLIIKYALRRRDSEDVVREVFRMVEKGKTTFKIPDEKQLVITAGNLRKTAEKFTCGDIGRVLRFLCPEAFERGRLYPSLLPDMYMKDGKNDPFIIRMQEDDARWAAINLKTGSKIGWKNIYDFEEEIFQLNMVIISKEEAFALL